MIRFGFLLLGIMTLVSIVRAQDAKDMAVTEAAVKVVETAKFESITQGNVLLTGGNTDTQTYSVNTKNDYVWDLNTFTLGGLYTKGEVADTTTVENWNVFGRYTRRFSDRWSVFLGQMVEGDEFNRFETRYNTDIGVRFDIHKSKPHTAWLEAGYRYTKEDLRAIFAGTREEELHKARVYFETLDNWSDSFYTRLWVEALPNFTESDDWIVNFEPSLGFRMNSNFSFNVGYLGRYQNLPGTGLKKFDYQTTAGVTAKF